MDFNSHSGRTLRGSGGQCGRVGWEREWACVSHAWASVMLLLAESGVRQLSKQTGLPARVARWASPGRGVAAAKATGPREAKPVPVAARGASGPGDRPTFFPPWRRQAGQGAAWRLVFKKLSSSRFPSKFHRVCPLGGAARWREKGDQAPETGDLLPALLRAPCGALGSSWWEPLPARLCNFGTDRMTLVPAALRKTSRLRPGRTDRPLVGVQCGGQRLGDLWV